MKRHLFASLVASISLAIGLRGQPVAPSQSTIDELRFIEQVKTEAGLELANLTAEPMVMNPATRAESRAFYRAIYFAGVSNPIEWTGTLSGTPGTSATGTPGDTSALFKEAVRTRINWYRALAGVPAQVQFNSTYSAKSQQAALMMSANNTLSHTPPNTWLLYTAQGAEAAGNSNLAIGSFGVEAVNGYMVDPGNNNAAVGHRRWILYPQTRTMGTGDVDPLGSFNTANSLWVMDGNFNSARPAVRDGFVAWPTKGHVPYTVIPARWSFSYPGANFSSATITVTRDGASVTAAKETITNGYGENTVVFIVNGMNTASRQPHSRPTADITYAVTISGITGATQSSYSYNVIVFDPDTSGPGETTPSLSGPNSITVGVASTFTATLPSFASAYEWREVVLAPHTLIWGAETGTSPDLIAEIYGSYSVRETGAAATGSASYHLCHVNPTTNSLTAPLTFYVTSASASLSFSSRLGWASTTQTARAQISTDDGQSWTDAYSQSGTDAAGESAFTTRSASLAAYAGRTIKVRFAYTFEGGTYFNQSSTSVGWLIDNITLSNVQITTNGPGGAEYAATSLAYTAASSGNIALQIRPVLFGQFPMDWSALKVVTASGTNTAPSISSHPASTSVTVGQTATFSVTASGNPTPTYQWRKNGTPISGATSSSYTTSAVTLSDNGALFTVAVTNSVSTVISNAATLTVSAVATAPSISSHPASTSVNVGQTATFSVTASGNPTPTYQWSKNSTPISGATSSSYTTSAVTLSDNGALFTVAVTNSVSTVVSNAATLTVSANQSRLYNLSIRARAGVNGPLIVGFTPTNNNGTPILVRAVGPTLGTEPFNVPGVMADPRLDIYLGATIVANNDNWASEGIQAMQTAFASAGAFGLTNTSSLDAAKIHQATGARTVHVNAATGGAGVVIVEAYDRGDATTPRLTNLSARNYCGSGADVMICGFTISGTAPMRLLVRAVGPGLSQWIPSGLLADPNLEIHTTVNGADTVVATNDNWSDEAGAAAAMSTAGAFNLSAGSKDAVLVRTLNPGSYTAVASGKDNGTGEALIELYELP